MRDLAQRRNAGLLYGTNFSVGVQLMLQLATEMASTLSGAGYTFTIEETHHATKLDSPSGTALTLQEATSSAGEVPIVSRREGEAAGLHVLEARGGADRIVRTH